MGKTKYCFIATFICAILVGCSGNTNEESEHFDAINKVDAITKESLVYVSDTDDQPNFRSEVYTEDGIYSMGYADDCDSFAYIMTFYDYETGQNIPVCTKTNCNHNDEGCDAIFEEKDYPSMLDIGYYEGFIYVLYKNDGDLFLGKIAPDGSNREISCKLLKTDTLEEEEEDGQTSLSTYYPEWTIHRGYVYYTTTYPGNTKPQLMRVKLNSNLSDEVEILYTRSGDYPDLYRISGFGDYVFFQAGNYTDSDMTELDAQLYLYDIDSGEISLVAEKVNREYTISENKVYYFDSDYNVAVYDVRTDERKIFCETEKGDEMSSQYTLFTRDEKIYYILTDYDDDLNEIVKEYECSVDGDVLGIYGEDELVRPF